MSIWAKIAKYGGSALKGAGSVAKQEMMLLADFSNLRSPCQFAIEMNNHDGFGLRCNSGFYQLVIYL